MPDQFLKVIWTDAASLDIQRHYNNLKDKDQRAAIAAIERILAVGDRLESSPYMGPKLASNERLRKQVVNFGKYGFVILYTVETDAVVILKVYHGLENRPV